MKLYRDSRQSLHTVISIFTKYSQLNWALADQAMVSAVNFLTGFLLARHLGVAEYGRFSLAWMVVLFFNSLQTAAVISPMMSIGPKQPEGEDSFYYGSVFIQQFFWTAGSYLFLIAGLWISQFFWPEWQLLSLALPLSTALVAFQVQDFLRRYFFVRHLPARAFVIDTISYLGQLLILLILVSQLDVYITLFIVAATSTAAVIVCLFWLGPVSFSRNKYKTHTLHHIHFSKWLIGSAIMQWTSGNYFILAASAQLGPGAAGAIRATQNIVAVTHILFQGLSNIVPVQSAKTLYTDGMRAFKSYLKKISLLGGGITALFCIVIGATPETWLGLFYGKEYLAYSFVLRWWSISYLLIFFGVPLSAGIRALENTKPIFIAYFSTTCLSITLASPVVRHFGLAGAMSGILISQIIIIAILLFNLLHRLKSINMHNYTNKVVYDERIT